MGVKNGWDIGPTPGRVKDEDGTPASKLMWLFGLVLAGGIGVATTFLPAGPKLGAGSIPCSSICDCPSERVCRSGTCQHQICAPHGLLAGECPADSFCSTAAFALTHDERKQGDGLCVRSAYKQCPVKAQ